MDFNYSCPINSQVLKMYRKELVYDDGFISSFLKINARVAYCEGYILDNISSTKSKFFPRVGEWKGTQEMVAKFFPEFYDYITRKQTKLPFEKWSAASKHLKVLCDMNFITVKKEDDYDRLIYSISVPNYFNAWKDAFKVNRYVNSATTKNGFFFCERQNIIDLINALTMFVGERDEESRTKEERLVSYKDKQLPKNVRRALMNIYKKDTINYSFSVMDAFYDLLSNACYNDRNVKGSELGAIVTINYEPIVTYAALAERWNWSKSKVYRFFKAMKSVCTVYHLTGNKGTVIYLNQFISTQSRNKDGGFVEDFLPTKEAVMRTFASDFEKIKSSPIATITKKFAESAKNLLKKMGVISYAQKAAEEAELNYKLDVLFRIIPVSEECYKKIRSELEGNDLSSFECDASQNTRNMMVEENEYDTRSDLKHIKRFSKHRFSKNIVSVFKRVKEKYLNAGITLNSKTDWICISDEPAILPFVLPY